MPTWMWTCIKCHNKFEVFNRNQSRICDDCRYMNYKKRDFYGDEQDIHISTNTEIVSFVDKNLPKVSKLREGNFTDYVRLVNSDLAAKLLGES